MADIRDIYRENVSRFHYIATVPALHNITGKVEKVSLYWVNQGDQVEQITNGHLVTLGKHQQQFLGSFKPKLKETGDIPFETPPTDKKTATSSSSIKPNAESQQQDNSEEREGLIQALLRSNGYLAADVAFLRRRIHKMTAKQKEIYLRSQIDPDDTGDTPSGCPKRIKDKIQVKELNVENGSSKREKSNKQSEIDRQMQLVMQIKEEEKQLQRIKEVSREELAEQKRQRERLQKERLDMERAIQASIRDEEKKTEKNKTRKLSRKKEKRSVRAKCKRND